MDNLNKGPISKLSKIFIELYSDLERLSAVAGFQVMNR